MSKYKVGQRLVYMSHDLEDWCEILNLPECIVDLEAHEKRKKEWCKNNNCPYPLIFEWGYGENYYRYRVIVDDKIVFAHESELYEKNSIEYLSAKLRKLEIEIIRLKNKGFFARLFG